MATITSLLGEMKAGNAGAADRLFAHVYEDLKDVARRHLRDQRGGVLQATSLVSAAYERLASRELLEAANRRHLFYLFSRAMHDVLVEEVRRDLAEKRGGKLQQIPLMEVAVDGFSRLFAVLDLQQALAELEQIDPDSARVVTLRFYGGLSIEEAAQETGQTFAITRGHWEYAKAWMHERLAVPKTSAPGHSAGQ